MGKKSKVQFHFAELEENAYEPQYCKYFENCPAKLHFDSIEEATEYISKITSDANKKFDHPIIKFLTAEDLQRSTSVIEKPNNLRTLNRFTGQYFSKRNEDTRKDNQKLAKRTLDYLAEFGIISYIVDTETHINGKNKPEVVELGMRWLIKDKYPSGLDDRLDYSLKLSDEGEKIYSEIQNHFDSISKAEEALFEIESDAYNIKKLKKEISKINKIAKQNAASQLSTLSVTTDLLNKASILVEAQNKSDEESFTYTEIAELLGTSNGTAAVTSRKLAILGLAKKTYRREYGRSYVSYSFKDNAVNHLGGIQKIFNA